MMDNSQTVPKLTLQRRIESMDLVFMAAGRQECKPSDSSGPRTCSYHMLHFVLKGKVHFYLGGQHYIVNAGQCFYVPEGTNTFYYSDPTNPCIYAWVNFTGDDAVEIVRECGMSNVCPHDRLAGCEAYLGFDWRTIALLWSDARQRYSDPRVHAFDLCDADA